MRSTRLFERESDFLSNFINIDTLVDILTVAQETEGIEPTFSLAKIDDNGNKTRKVDDKKEVEKLKVNKCKNNCHSCNTNNERQRDPDTVDWDAFKLPFDSDDDYECDENEVYICDYCESLGYTQKYIPDVCDRCSVCESCTEYGTDCDGCSYSVFRDGQYYRDKLSESDLVDSDDLDKFNNLGDTVNKRLELKPFTVSRKI